MLTSNKKKIYVILILLFVVLNIFKLNSYAIVSPTREFYVNDYANLLSSETEKYIINTNLNLNNKTGAQIVVVTVKNLEGQALEEYANKLYRTFGIGDSNKDNGVLMLLALEEREFRIEVGYGLEGCLPDGKTGRIRDQYILPYLRENKWDEGIKNGYNAIIEVVANEYGVDVNSEEPVEYSSENEDFAIFIAFIIIAIVFFIIIKNGGGSTHIFYGGGYHGGYNSSRSRGYSSGRSSSGSRRSFGGGGSSGRRRKLRKILI